MSILRWSAIIVLLAVPLPARADLITNGSFEEGSPQPTGSGIALPTGSTTMPGWTVIGGTAGDGLAWLSNANPFGGVTPFGNNFLDLTGFNDRAPYFGVSQTITTVVGQQYTLSFDLGVDQSDARFKGPIGLTATADGSSLAVTNFNPAGTGNIWQAFSLNFAATSTSTLISLQGTQGTQYIGLDNVSVNPAAVPEPSAFALLGVGGLGMALARARRRARGPNTARPAPADLS